MSQAEQTTLRYNYLMQATADAQGDFARTSDSFANQQRVAQLNIENLSAEVGQALVPALNQALQAFNEWATNGEATSGMLSNLSTVAEILVNVLTKSAIFLMDHLEGITYTLTAIGAAKGMWALGEGLSVAVESAKALRAGIIAATAAEEALTTAEVAAGVAAKANPIGLIMAGVAVAVMGAIAAFDALTVSQKELEATAEASQQAYTEAKTAVEDTTRKIEDNKAKLIELQKQWDKGFHTQALADNLNTVTKTTAALEAQLKVQKEAELISQKKADEDQLALLNSKKTEDGFAAANNALNAYKNVVALISSAEQKRDEALRLAQEARLAGNEEEAIAQEKNAATYSQSYESAKKGQQFYYDSMVKTSAGLSEQTAKLSGVTEESKNAKEMAESYALQVADLVMHGMEYPVP